MRKIFLLTILALIVLAVVGFAIYIKGYYHWYSPDDKTQYQNATWHPITTARLAGFTPQLGVSEKATVPCKAYEDRNAHYLRREGGLCATGFWLEISLGPLTKRIDTLGELKLFFSPVDSAGEAVSFVAVTTRDLKIGPHDVLEGRISIVNNAYLAEVIHENTFGCGNHEPTKVIYKVTKAGDIEKIAEEQKPQLGLKAICVD